MPMKYKTFLRAALLIILLFASAAQAEVPRPGLAGATFAAMVLLPGDSKSVEMEYEDVLLRDGSFNMTFISAVIPDNQIHFLRINLTPRIDRAADIGYFSAGGFIYTNTSAGKSGFLQFLEPRLTYGTDTVSYIIDVYPTASVGVVFSAVMIEYQDFDFPFKMTMTATLSK
jgi:hypothetical protein